MSHTWGLALALLLSATGAQAQVWKCTVEGKVRYSDQPCPSKGEPMKARALQDNVIDASADRARLERARSSAAEQAAMAASAAVTTSPAAAPANVCPSDQEIAGLETKASSITLSPEAKRFVQDEIRRIRQCRKGQGRYSAADWAISKQAVEAQSSHTGGPDARRRAEAMHSAADPVEGDRIARQRELEEREAQRREQRLRETSR